MPDHLHCIWTLPAGDADFSSRWQAIKARVARAIPAGEQLSPRRQGKGARGIWQGRFWEHLNRDLNLNYTTGGMRCAFPPYALLRELSPPDFTSFHPGSLACAIVAQVDAIVSGDRARV
ncbi:MAG: hypothetical protein A3G24_06610 [Betaproteobacteria bacterium RIFCSPLOWO2_12_FULL_62_13]|nr:MAG: hypothetical protein A3G24_06610 [Betaproteobacteria bacterium RIFCSPLOWO2_12_FULL_62_13]